eukprot:TRINITY_DN5921_c0_g1_i2.p1 TRINITY_DN5921_c0_g1~~TRINITY_DN5921_c0_g1_i2.p1  ORF type:complete len:1565 (-),score=227.86 TRINITY_DN5921_c0_g1_i2:121-4245(-)
MGVWDKYVIPASYLFWIPQFELSCLGPSFNYTCAGTSYNSPTSTNCRGTPLFPSDDPLSMYYRSLVNNTDPVSNNDMLITNLLIYEERVGQKICTPFSEENLKYCNITYTGLVDSSALQDPLVAEAVIELHPVSERTTCNYTDYVIQKTMFEESIKKLDIIITNYTFDYVKNIVFESVSYVVSDSWAICSKKSNSFVSSTTEIVPQNITCPWDPFTNASSFLSDPCCNAELQLTQCCVKSVKKAPKVTLTPNIDLLTASCNFPKCSTSTAESFASVSSSAGRLGSTCAEASRKELNSKQYYFDSLFECFYRVYGPYCETDAACQAYNGTCINFYCVYPCKNDSDCYKSYCQPDSYCFPGNLTDPKYDFTVGFFECIVNFLDPYLSVYIQDNIDYEYNRYISQNGNSSLVVYNYSSDLVNKFLSVNSPPSCFPSVIFPLTYDTMEECVNASYCSWARCVIDNVDCTEANCLDTIVYPTPNYCGECYNEDGCYEYSVFPQCFIHEDPIGYDESLCTSFGGHFNPLLSTNQIYSNCIIPNSTQGDCIPPQLCNPISYSPITQVYEYYCDSFCYIPGNFTVDECQNRSTVDYITILDEWTINGVNYSLCKYQGVDMTDCTSLWNDTIYFPGKTWVMPTSTSYESCGSCFREGVLDVYTETEANCSIPACNIVCDNCSTAEVCTANGLCSYNAICITPYQTSASERSGLCDTITPCPSGGWSPFGCIVTNVAQADCEAIENATYVRLNTSDVCLSYQVCREISVADTEKGDLTIDGTDVIKGYSSKNRSECEKCGGYMVPLFKWTPGAYVAGHWFLYQWLERNIIQGDFRTSINFNSVTLFAKQVRKAQARRATSIAKNELMCRYGLAKDSIESLMCDCNGEGDRVCGRTDQGQTIKKSLDGAYTICSGIEKEIDTANGLIKVPDNISLVSGSKCVDVVIYLISQSQFNERQSLKLSSASIRSTQDRASELRTIENSNNVVVGEWIGEGYSWTMNDTFIDSNHSAVGCIMFPPKAVMSTVFTWNENYKIYDLIKTKDFIHFSVVGLNIVRQNESDFSVPAYGCVVWEKDYVYFPIGLVEDWKTRTYIQTWEQGIIAVLYIGVVLYIPFLVAASWNLVLHIKSGEKKVLPKLSLTLLSVFLLDRIIYFILTSVGAFASAPALETIFSELPGLFYLSIICLIVIQWAEIYHYKFKKLDSHKNGQLQKLVIACNLFIYACFVVLLIIYSTVGTGSQEVDCTTPQSVLEQVTPSDGVVYAYKAIYAALCCVMSFLVAFYGSKAVNMLNVSSKTRKAILTGQSAKFLLLSVICSATTLVNAFLLIGTSVEKSPNPYAVLIVLFLIELPSAGIIINLFNKTSVFIAGITTQVTSGVGSTDSRNTN